MAEDFGALWVPDYVLISESVEVAAALLTLVACLALVRRGPAALVGALGALLAGSATGLALVDTLILMHGDDGPWLAERGWQLVSYGRAVGLGLVALAVLLALTRRPTPVPAGPA